MPFFYTMEEVHIQKIWEVFEDYMFIHFAWNGRKERVLWFSNVAEDGLLNGGSICSGIGFAA